MLMGTSILFLSKEPDIEIWRNIKKSPYISFCRENEEEIGYREEIVALPLEETEEKQGDSDNRVYSTFNRLAGADGEIDWSGLKEILDSSMKPELKMVEFSKDVCRSLVAMLDTDCSGKLSLKEFQKLWAFLNKLKKAWILHDVAKSGTIHGYELRDALKGAGYWINTGLLNILMYRYGERSGKIIFEDFMMCAIKLKTMIDAFQDQVDEDPDIAAFTIEEFLERSLYC